MNNSQQRPIPGYPDYFASEDGLIFSEKSGCRKPLTLIKGSKGYYIVNIMSPSGRKTRSVHHLIALAFHENPDNKPMVAHGDGNRTNNTASNLRWATAMENANDTERHGRQARGERQGNSILTDELVRKLRSEFVPFVVTAKILAEKYGIPKTCVVNVTSGTAWRHVK